LSRKRKENDLNYEIAGMALILASIYIYISLFSSNSGIVGEKIRLLILGIFGLGAYIVPILIIILGFALVYRKNEIHINIKFYSFCIFLLSTLIVLFIANYSEVEKADANWLDAVRYHYSLGTLIAREGVLGGIGGGAV
jgi:S-DNA-T family DNA segregation ATPase FtsK/SpoIIIE